MIIAASVLSVFNIRSPDAEKLRNDQLNLSEKLMTSGIIRFVVVHFEREDTALSKLDFVLAIRVRLIVASSQGPKTRLILFTGTRKRVRHCSDSAHPEHVACITNESHHIESENIKGEYSNKWRLFLVKSPREDDRV